MIEKKNRIILCGGEQIKVKYKAGCCFYYKCHIVIKFWNKTNRICKLFIVYVCE